jgi:hypothetical protein
MQDALGHAIKMKIVYLNVLLKMDMVINHGNIYSRIW